MVSEKKMHEDDKDLASEMLITGRYQAVPRDPAAEFKRTTLAAGAVLPQLRACDTEVRLATEARDALLIS